MDILDELLWNLRRMDEFGDIFYYFQTVSAAIIVILLLINVAQAFFGFKLFKFWVAFTGFFFFGFVGLIIGGFATKGSDATIIIALAIAILGAFVAYKLYLVGVFIMMGFFAFVAGMILTENTAVSALLAIVFGILGVIFTKPIIIIMTSISGGLTSGSLLTTQMDSGLAYTIGAAIIIGGAYYQFISNQHINTNNGAIATRAVGTPLQSGALHGKTCLTCGTHNHVTTKFCTTCGNEFVLPAVERSTCQSCGTMNAVTSKFCITCGAPTARMDTSDKIACSNCGTFNAKSSKFCITCGHGMANATEEVAAAMSASADEPTAPAAPTVQASEAGTPTEDATATAAETSRLDS